MKLNNSFTIWLNKQQFNTLKKLKSDYRISTSHFIREAISEKIKRDYPKLQEKKARINCPF